MPTRGPFLIDVANGTRWPDDTTGMAGPFENGNDLYMVWSSNVTFQLSIWKSVDRGATWNPVAGGPLPASDYNWAVQGIGATIRIVAYVQVGPVWNITLYTFTMGPDALAVVDTLPAHPIRPIGYDFSAVGAYDVIYTQQTVLGVARIFIQPYQGGAWLAPFELAPDLAPNLHIRLDGTVPDPAGMMNVFIHDTTAIFPFTPFNFWYRRFDPAGVLTGLVALPLDPTFGNEWIGSPKIFGAMVLLPHANPNPIPVYSPAVLVMDNWALALPTPTDFLYGAVRGHSPEIVVGPASAYLWWTNLDVAGSGVFSQLAYVPFDGAVFGALVLWYNGVPNSPYPLAQDREIYDVSSPVRFADGRFGYYGALNYPGEFDDGRGWYWEDTVAGHAPVIIPTQGSRRMVVLVPNKFDQCLAEYLRVHLHHRPHKVCCQLMLWHNINWVRAPERFTPFRKTASIPTPLPGADSVVLSFMVPHGYDGVIAGLFHRYTGPGFQEGNGDIEWRLLVNRTYAVQLGRVLVSLGSQQQCYPVDGGIFVQGGTTIQYLVNVPNLSGGILPVNSQIVCGLEGLFYARA